jgi:hypothetical protein
MDVSNNSKYNFGFKVNHIYKAKVDLAISEPLRCLWEISPIDRNSLADKRCFYGVVPVGSSFEVFQLKYNMAEMSGVIWAKAIILDGEFKGEQVYVQSLTMHEEGSRHGYPNTNLVEVVKVVDPLPF